MNFLKIKNILSKLFSRNAISAILLIAQIIFLILAINRLQEKFYFFYFCLIVLDIILAVCIVNKDDNPSYKLAWIVSISVLPIFGGVAYIFIQQSQKLPKSMGIRYQRHARKFLKQDSTVMKQLGIISKDGENLAKYVTNYGPYPVYRHTTAEYFPLGEFQFESLVRELNNAQKFIFMEFFIISPGYMFDTISEILIRKAEDGVDVRLMYDGIGTGMLNSTKAFRRLEEHGVKCKVFNKFTPFLSTMQNNRDHRKIVVIDGKIAYNGGTNLADEYINRIERFGHWKDTAVMIRGEAVWNYTVMFLQLWETREKNLSDYEKFVPAANEFSTHPSDGFIQPFSDSPLDNELVGKLVYMELINNAREYVYITTPYLIIDDELATALKFAAQKGIDVRIITPHIPDKWYVHRIAWNTYPKLIKAGVKIYEYTPGFIHAKTCIADGQTAVVGTINLDYRSFYLHFESAAIFYNCSVIGSMEADFSETLRVSHPVTLADCKKRPLIQKLSGAVLNIFAPLL